jgi:diadenosine tetraphosphate (Ap4A) HIT family hydrolase
MKKNNNNKIFEFNLTQSELDFIDQRLINDSIVIAKLDLSYLLLYNDSNYPWLILVPKVNEIYDLTDLEFSDQQKLLKEINICSDFLKKNFTVDKLNIASLGNIVKQLHIHIIARTKNDQAFPKPVWGFADPKKYSDSQVNEIIIKIKNYLINYYND